MKRLFLFLLLLPFANSGFAQVSCNLVYERTLQGFNVYIDSVSGATMYRAKEYVDADGSPRAYGPNNSGLDWTANAGFTGNWWGVVADASGQNPILQTASDPFPGMYVSTTSLVNSNYGISNPLRYVNSETVPFIAMPTNVLASGNIHVGDVAYVYNTTTGQHCFAIYADAGNTTSIGEGSIYLAMQDGVDPDVRTGGTSLGIIDYIVFPQSGFGQGYIPTIAQIDSIGNLFLNAAGGPCIVSCLGPVYDNMPPTTLISLPSPWDTTSFNVTFTDADSGCVGSIGKSFYQICDYNSNNEWRANNANGFFNDDFNGNSINVDWTSVTGTWTMNVSNYLEQSDQALSNTNIYANLTQNLSNRYLYEWQGKISGTGSNRRAGLEFFCDNPTLPNRGNNYFVWFRADQSTCEFYKVTNDVFSLVHSVPMTIAINSWNDYKVTYDRITGEIVVYQNDNLIGSWTDSSPISNGNSVSFRSGNCDWQIDNFKVFRSRNTSVAVSAGTGNANDIRFQNQNPATPSGRISSVVTDSMKNISVVVSQNVNIDFSNPSGISALNDGPASDIDTTFVGNQLEANWASSVDPNSGVVLYYYAIGTTPGGTDVVNWTNNGNNTSVTATGLTLIHQQVYYFCVQAVDGANLKSPVIISDGQLYFDITTNIQIQNLNAEIIVYPNPSNGIFVLNSKLIGATISVNNASGEEVYSGKTDSDKTEINLSDKPDGIYFVVLKRGDVTYMQKIIIQR
jgi:hypothetical protein